MRSGHAPTRGRGRPACGKESSGSLKSESKKHNRRAALLAQTWRTAPWLVEDLSSRWRRKKQNLEAKPPPWAEKGRQVLAREAWRRGLPRKWVAEDGQGRKSAPSFRAASSSPRAGREGGVLLDQHYNPAQPRGGRRVNARLVGRQAAGRQMGHQIAGRFRTAKKSMIIWRVCESRKGVDESGIQAVPASIRWRGSMARSGDWSRMNLSRGPLGLYPLIERRRAKAFFAKASRVLRSCGSAHFVRVSIARHGSGLLLGHARLLL